MDRRKVELYLGLGVRLLALGVVVYLVVAVVRSLFSKDSWPPKDEQEAAKLVAEYKQKLRVGDSPLSPRAPEDTAVYLSRIIDHDVKAGDLKSAREYAAQAVTQRLDERVEGLLRTPPAKDLLGRVRNGVKKRDALTKVIARSRQPGGDDRELQDLVAQFCAVPFDAAACPELAGEIQSGLGPAAQDSRLKAVAEEVERNCRPR